MLEPCFELARRIDAADVHLGHALVLAFESLFPREFADFRELGGGALFAVGGMAPIARVVGMGLVGSVDARDLEQLVGLLDMHQLPAEVRLGALADASLAPRLRERGFAPVGRELVLAREVLATDRNCAAPSHFSIHGMHPREAESWARMVAASLGATRSGAGTATDLPAGAFDSLLATATADGFLGFLVRLGSEIVAAGGMWCAGDVASLVGHVTHAPFRRRGVQRALIAHSLAVAAERGLGLAKLNVRENTISLRNFELAGFVPVETRAVLARPAAISLRA